MRHVFLATKIGWEEEKEYIWFDSNLYSKEDAESQCVPYQATTQDGYPYTGYEYDGEKYHHYKYIGEFEDGVIPPSYW